MKLLLINQDWFAAEWRENGHEVVVIGSGPECDVRIDLPLMHWQSLCPKGFSPDYIVVHDNSSPVVITGLEEAEIPVVFYSVDTHHHASFHRYYSHAFDATFVAQKDYIERFHEAKIEPHWLPLWASRRVEASQEKRYDAIFIGTMNPTLNPERVKFFEALKTRVPLIIERGEYWNFFPFAEIVVNQTVKGDLNFRVFEAMMCGAMLLTESSGNGLTDLFEPGKHLVTYMKGDVDDAASKIDRYLKNKEECHAIAAAGRAEIVNKHLPQHRAAEMMEVLRNIKTKRQSRSRYFGAMLNYHSLSTGLEKLDRSLFLKSLLTTLQCAEKALAQHEEINQDFAIHVLIAAIRYDFNVPGRAGFSLVKKLAEQYPEQIVLTLGVIRGHLNHGERNEAQLIAEQLNIPNVEESFALAEKLVADLLGRFS